MTADRSNEYLAGLVRELCKQPAETEWLEFKRNNSDPQEIGEYLSALANSAALCGKAFAYLVWGIENTTHALVGTTFVPQAARVGGEELESWLLRALSPKIHFRFHPVEVEGHPLVLLEIGRAFRHPVQFQNQEFIRVGSYKKRLKDFPENGYPLDARLVDRCVPAAPPAHAIYRPTNTLQCDHPWKVAMTCVKGIPIFRKKNGRCGAFSTARRSKTVWRRSG